MSYLLVVVMLSGRIHAISLPREVDSHQKCMAIAHELTEPIKAEVKNFKCFKHVYKEV